MNEKTFFVGDRVRVISNKFSAGHEPGTTGTVTEVHELRTYSVAADVDSGGRWAGITLRHLAEELEDLEVESE